MFVLYKGRKDSKVVRYEILKDMVTLQFKDSSSYVYTNQSATPENIEKMKKLATAGKGLGTFVEANLKDLYMRKVR